MKKVLIALHDPGATSFWLPVIEKLQQKQVSLEIFSKSHGKPLPSQMSTPECDGFMASIEPNVVITGTSWGSNSEQMIRNYCFEKNIEYFTAVDYWANYQERWNGASYKPGQAKEKIFVIDQHMKSDMIKTGFREHSLSVVGHPALEMLEMQTPKLATTTPHRWLFLAEPSSRVNFMWILNIFDKLQNDLGKIEVLDYKMHPKEQDPQNWRTVFEKLSEKRVSSSEVQGDTRALFMKYEGVMGYQTMGLFEAAFSGLQAVAIPDQRLSQGLQHAMKDSGIYIHSEFKDDGLTVVDKRTVSFVGATEKILNEVLVACS